MRVKNGFTLTELLLVVALLAILAALVLPRFTGSVEQGRVSEGVGILNAIRQGEEAYKNEKGDYLSLTVSFDTASNLAWNDIGLENPNLNANRFFNYRVDKPTGTTGQILIVAARNDNPTGNQFGDAPAGGGETEPHYVVLNQSGIWSGTHPLRPQNANSGVCGTTDLPGPCWTPSSP